MVDLMSLDPNNSGPSRFYGTRVTVQLTSKRKAAPTWEELQQYIREVCRNLEFELTLEHITTDGVETFEVVAEGLVVPIPAHLTATAIRIPVDVADLGLKGEIVFYRAPESASAQATLANATPINAMDVPVLPRTYGLHGTLLRGGFRVGGVPGLPTFTLAPDADARVEVTRSTQDARSLPVTDLSRSRLTEQIEIEASIFRVWMEFLLRNIEDIEARPIGNPEINQELFRNAKWLESYSAFDLFRLAKSAWPHRFGDPSESRKTFERWQSGRGRSIWVGGAYSNDLATVIFGLILPKITSIVVGDEGNYFARPPRLGWQDMLGGWHTQIRDGLRWPTFVEFIPPIADVLFDTYGNNAFLNKKFERQFDEFELSEVNLLRPLITRLVRARSVGRREQFERSEIDLLVRFSQAAGDLRVMQYRVSHNIGELIKGKSQMPEGV